MQARKSPPQNTPIWIASSCVSFESASVQRHDAKARRQHREKDLAPIPALAVEAEDEREQIDRERHDPEQRHGRDVLRDVVRHGEEQQRAGGRECRTTAPGARRSAAPRISRLPWIRVSRDAGDGRGAGHAFERSTSPPRRKDRRRARSRPTSPTPACASVPTARTGTDSRRAPASTRGSTARTADTGSRRAAPARTRPGPAGSSSTAGSTASRSSRRAAPRISHDGLSAPVGFQ